MDMSRRNDPPSFEQRVSLLLDIAEGMEYLHCVHGSIHRDLKTANCLLNREAGVGENSSSMVIRAKVADFGLSRFMQSSMNEKSKTDLLNKRKENEEAKTPDYGSRIMTAGQGTAVYMAPEIVSSAMHTYSSYSMKVDVYVVENLVESKYVHD